MTSTKTAKTKSAAPAIQGHLISEHDFFKLTNASKAMHAIGVMLEADKDRSAIEQIESGDLAALLWTLSEATRDVCDNARFVSR